MNNNVIQKTHSVSNAAGYKLWCREYKGQGELPPLIIVHGGPGLNHEYLLSLIDIASDRSVYFYDQLDCGQSDKPANKTNWTVDCFVNELESVVASLRLQEVYVFGHSWGGTIAAMYAARQPSQLLGLILASPMLEEGQWRSDQISHRDNLEQSYQNALNDNEKMGTLDNENYLAAVEVYTQKHFCRMDPWPEEIVRSFNAINEEMFGEMWGDDDFCATGTLQGYSCSEYLENVLVHTLYICGEHDQVRPDSCKRWSNMTQYSDLVVIPDASHCLHFEKRTNFNTKVQQFLTSLDSEI